MKFISISALKKKKFKPLSKRIKRTKQKKNQFKPSVTQEPCSSNPSRVLLQYVYSRKIHTLCLSLTHFLLIIDVSAEEKAKFVRRESPTRRRIRHPDSAASEILNPIQVRFKILVLYNHKPHFHYHTPQSQPQPTQVISIQYP